MSSGLNNGTGAGGLTADTCAGCHRAHTAQSDTLLMKSSVTELCLSCHGGGATGATTNVVNGVQFEPATSDALHRNASGRHPRRPPRRRLRNRSHRVEQRLQGYRQPRQPRLLEHRQGAGATERWCHCRRIRDIRPHDRPRLPARDDVLHGHDLGQPHHERQATTLARPAARSSAPAATTRTAMATTESSAAAPLTCRLSMAATSPPGPTARSRTRRFRRRTQRPAPSRHAQLHGHPDRGRHRHAPREPGSSRPSLHQPRGRLPAQDGPLDRLYRGNGRRPERRCRNLQHPDQRLVRDVPLPLPLGWQR